MVETRRSERSDGLYGRLLQRLALALDEAEMSRRLHDVEPQSVELKGLTDAEIELIQAYLKRDLHWLQGWHAAAAELEHLKQQAQLPLLSRAQMGERVPGSPWTPARLLTGKAAGKRRQQLCCAMCGTQVPWMRGQGVQPCPACGAQLFRPAKPR